MDFQLTRDARGSCHCVKTHTRPEIENCMRWRHMMADDHRGGKQHGGKVINYSPAVQASHCSCGDERGAECFVTSSKPSGSVCVHEQTSASASVWGGLHCLLVSNAAQRGVFVASRSSSGQRICTGGDHYHAWLTSDRLQLAALSKPLSSSVYWLNLSASALLPEAHRFELDIALVETVRRVPGSLPSGNWDDLASWLRRSEAPPGQGCVCGNDEHRTSTSTSTSTIISLDGIGATVWCSPGRVLSGLHRARVGNGL
jgi:hypothetical protein